MSDGDAKTERWSIAPYLIVDDVVVAATFYRDQLGFTFDRFWGEPPAFCMVRRGGITIMLSQLEAGGEVRPNRKADPHGEAWDAYIWVEDADSLCQEFKSRGLQLHRDICEQEYGCRDFEVEDCNGYRLCFGSELDA